MDAAAILERTHGVLNARQVIGDPYEKNGTMVLPVVCIRGGGGGGGDESGEGDPTALSRHESLSHAVVVRNPLERPGGARMPMTDERCAASDGRAAV